MSLDNNQTYSYILITAARNEASFLKNTILSVISQTKLPLQWIIISDGSTDQTDAIIKEYTAKYSWIKYIRMPSHHNRHFAAKARCFNVGYETVKNFNFDIIGNLDADLTFEKDFFEFLLKKFTEIPDLGVAGTPFIDSGSPGHYNYRYTNINHVSGACQLFRKKCFDSIGGYQPIEGGGIDWVAVTSARMHGWKTKTFLGKTLIHHRKMGSGIGNSIKSGFIRGKKDYYLGGHPLWELLRVIYQMKNRPYFLGGIYLLWGYLFSMFFLKNQRISPELVNFNQKEQLQRLKSILVRNNFTRIFM